MRVINGLIQRNQRKVIGYPNKISLTTPTSRMSLADTLIIYVETLRRGIRYSFEIEFNELVCRNHWIMLYITLNQV